MCGDTPLCSANAYNPEQLEGLNTNSKYGKWTALLQTVWYEVKQRLTCPGHQMEHTLHLHRVRKKKKFSCCLRRACHYHFPNIAFM
jgi:hypothetical protein